MIALNEGSGLNDKKQFSSEKEAIKYAEDNIGKYDWERVVINGNDYILTNTSIPFGDEFYSFAEDMLKDAFLDDELTPAEVRDDLMTAFENTCKIKFLSADLDF